MFNARLRVPKPSQKVQQLKKINHKNQRHWVKILLFILCGSIICVYLLYLVIISSTFTNDTFDISSNVDKIQYISTPFKSNITKIKSVSQILTFRQKPKENDMILLYYSSVFGRNGEYSYLARDFKQHICNISDIISGEIFLNQKVLLTSDRSQEQFAHGFIFHGPDIHQNIRTKNDNDIYIYHNMESPAATSISLTNEHLMNKFNLLMSYHFHADIFLPYVGRGTLAQLIETPILVSFADKNPDVPLAWIGSNCAAHNGRQIYLKELFKHVSTHSYGSCLNTDGMSFARGKPLKDVVKHYKFYVVMENSNCKDYITEKLGTAIVSSTVPVVFAIKTDDEYIPNYDKYMPSHSYINAADFASAKDLGQYLNYVASNESLYDSYLHYKYFRNEIEKNIVWNSILERYERKITAHHWCRAANAVFDYYLKGKLKTLKVDNSCLPSNVLVS